MFFGLYEFMRFLIFFWIFFNIQFIYAQLTDDFADGDFTNLPAWVGDVTEFQINGSGQLQLSNSTLSSSPDTSSLAFNSDVPEIGEWNWWMKQSFASSANNFSRVYLVSNGQDLKAPLNGYFVAIGGSNDSIGLFRQTGDSIIPVIAGAFSNTNQSVNELKIKVTRDAGGLWKLFSDSTGVGMFILEGQGTDNVYSTNGWTGIWAKYTTSNASRFYFDDFYAGPKVVDVTAPAPIFASAGVGGRLKLKFSEPVLPATAQIPSNYLLNPGALVPDSVAVDEHEPWVVHLFFLEALVSGTTYSLGIFQLEDYSGNQLASSGISFVYYIPGIYDVVISEIMADPDPPLGLPDEEWVEIYNRTNFHLVLSGWTFQAGSAIKEIPEIEMWPHEYLVLCDEDAKSFFDSIGLSAGFESFPALSNTGSTLLLRDGNGEMMFSMQYDASYYGDEDKKEGGWSMEMKDTQNPCGGSENWRASGDASGGTPGRENWAKEDHPDEQEPFVDRIAFVNSNMIRIYFSEPMDSLSVSDNGHYAMDHGFGHPMWTEVNGTDFSTVDLVFKNQMEVGIIYRLSVSSGLVDCLGKPIQKKEFKVGIPGKLEAGDLLVNEVLFNPPSGVTDFVEVINRSEKVLDLSQLVMGSEDLETFEQEDASRVMQEGLLVFPGDYAVFTEDKAALAEAYHCVEEQIFEVDKLPSLNVDGDVFYLTDLSGELIDRLHFRESWHFPLLGNVQGITLERIFPGGISGDSTLWHSAAESVGYGTPGFKNSQYFAGNLLERKVKFGIEPGIFSPDMDGVDDVTCLTIKTESPESRVRISVYDRQGRLVRNLVENELTGAEGFWFWDGVNNRNEKLPIGFYIVYAEIVETEGQVIKLRKTVTLASKLH